MLGVENLGVSDGLELPNQVHLSLVVHKAIGVHELLQLYEQDDQPLGLNHHVLLLSLSLDNLFDLFEVSPLVQLKILEFVVL